MTAALLVRTCWFFWATPVRNDFSAASIHSRPRPVRCHPGL